jgi:sugar phosphate permease
VLQGIALLLFLPFDGLVSLFVMAALFGLFQGGIVPAYAIIVREHFPPAQAGTRVGIALTATHARHGAGRLVVGRASSMSPAPTRLRSSTASPGTCSMW